MKDKEYESNLKQIEKYLKRLFEEEEAQKIAQGIDTYYKGRELTKALASLLE